MSQKLILGIFAGVVILGILLRVFVFDIVALTSHNYAPHFQAGEVLLVSKLSSVQDGEWAFLQDYPAPGAYSVRRLGHLAEGEPEIHSSQIVGQVVMTLWAFPCVEPAELCAQTSYKFLTFVN